ncbi:MAG: class I SAM-dependent methyltransferase [Candidatus Chromulinivorax sp.]|nr:class I SAM-dependent methyltransferase [Candidatus Chromulinivorax sp.]
MNYKWSYYYNLSKQFFRFALAGKGFMRTDNVIRDEYEDNWKKSERMIANLDKKQKKNWLLYSQPVISSRLQYTKTYMKRINQEMANAESVLELGGGNGLNLLLLAVLNPRIKILRSIELTQSGIQMAEQLYANPPIREISQITDIPPETVAQRLHGRDVKFLMGDMRNLPFEAETFDGVFSRLAIEQMPRHYPQIFSEAFRVTKNNGVGIFIEAFRDVQNIFNLMYGKINLEVQL